MRSYASLLALFMIAILCVLYGYAHGEEVSPTAQRYRSDLIREAHFVFGLDAPIPVLAAQIEQESGWRPGVTAWDNGRGLAQFMDSTATWTAQKFDLGKPDPYNPKWAIRAMTRLDGYNVGKVAGRTECDKWGAGLKAYNAGLGYVLRAQSKASEPGRWWSATEFINGGQSKENFEASRLYPHRIIFGRADKYSGWGARLKCD